MTTDELVTVDLRPTEVSTRTYVEVDGGDIDTAAERYHRSGAMLGEGGMGEVWPWTDTRIARTVAAKVLRGEHREDAEHRARFLVEARLQGQLEHPAIVPVYDLGTTPDGDLFFAMKQVHGITLRRALVAFQNREPRADRWSLRRLLTAFSSMCLAVDYAHRRGVVHRDLKPTNVMLGEFGEVYVLDWGIAKVMSEPDVTRRVDDATERRVVSGLATPTQAGTILGTPGYMAPEQALGAAEPRSDVYSLGVILSEICACVERCPPELEEIARRASELELEQRFATARELHDALERYLDGDRDLETRRRLAEEHARDASLAFELSRGPAGAAARARAAGNVGHALGLDPTNACARGTLVRLMTEPPMELPASVQAEVDRRWHERRNRTSRSAGDFATATLLLLVPMLVVLGVSSWALVAAYTVLAAAGLVLQHVWGHSPAPRAWHIVGAMASTFAALAILSTSMGLLGLLPAALAVTAVVYRFNVDRWIYGVLILLAATVALLIPLVLQWAGVADPTYVFRDGEIVLTPRMHAFPRVATQIYLVVTCVGAIGTGILYARSYLAVLRRAELQLAVQAWQLDQLVPSREGARVAGSPGTIA